MREEERKLGMMRGRDSAAANDLPMNLPEGDGIRRLADRRKLINLHFCTFEAFHHGRF